MATATQARQTGKTMNTLIDILNRWDHRDTRQTPRVLLAGDFMLDEYVYGDVDRISPEAPVPVLRVTKREHRPGGAGNVAAALRALGSEVVCIGTIGDDVAGGELTALLEKAGANVSGLVVTPGRPTTRKTRYVGLAQHKNPHQILREDEEQTQPLDDAIVAKLVAALESAAAAGPAVLALQDHNKGVLTGENALKLIAVAKQAHCTVVVDPALIDDYTRYRGATILTPNRYETALATGAAVTDNDSLAKAGQVVLERTDAQAVVITLDKQGAFLLNATGEQQHIPPTRTHEVADGTGAGDAVMATISAALAAGCEFPEAVALANVAGGLEVERFGVVPVTRDEMRDDLRDTIGLRRSKVLPREDLAALLARKRKLGQGPTVFTNGCFDLLHMGHVTYLQQAREVGSALIVAVNSDKSVQRLKGPQRPIVPQDERAAMLAALECVDYVTIFDEDTPQALLSLLQPEILVKGGSTDVIVGQDLVEAYGGRVQRLALVEGQSTTDIISRILETHDKAPKEG